MPYQELPQRYKDMIPSEDGQKIFLDVINSQLAAGKTEAVAFASAWAALERAGYAKDDTGKWVKKSLSSASKADDKSELPETAASSIIDPAMDSLFKRTSEVLKVDTERRIVWGWASVSTINGEPVTDLQGDIIPPAEMEKMADRFMASTRAAKVMHEGDPIGEVLHSLPLTNEIAKAFGIATDREGWIIGMKIHHDGVWQKFKDGTYKGFSIGGRAQREKLT